MTSGVRLSTLEQAYITVVRDRLTHAEIAYHLSELYQIPRTRKGVKDFFRRQRRTA